MYQFVFFTDLTDTIYVTKTIGAYKCAHVLRSEGYSCLVVDHLHSFSQEEFTLLLDKIISKETLGVAFSTTFMRNSNVLPNENGSVTFTEISPNTVFPQGKDFENVAIEKIKSISPSCKFIAGGTRVFPNYQNKNINYVTLGFSESSILNLANHLYKQEPLVNSTRNIWGITVIDDRYAAKYDFKTSNFLWEPTDIVNARVLPIEIARGCIFKCKFCSYPMNGKKNLDFVKDAELIRQELQDTYDRYGITTYSIVDDTFNDNDYKLDVILSAVKQLTFQPIFWAYIRLDLITTKKHIDKLYAIGVRSFYFGIETLNRETGKIVGKGFDAKKQIKAVQDLRNKYGDSITLHGSFIIGLPKESAECVTNTFNLLLDGTMPLHTFDFKALFIERGDKVSWRSEFGQNYEQYGYKDIGTIYDKYVLWQNEYMDMHRAIALEQEFRTIAQTKHESGIAGQALWSLMNYGYTLEELLSWKHKDINWHELTLHKSNYITEYKDKLNMLLSVDTTS